MNEKDNEPDRPMLSWDRSKSDGARPQKSDKLFGSIILVVGLGLLFPGVLCTTNREVWPFGLATLIFALLTILFAICLLQPRK